MFFILTNSFYLAGFALIFTGIWYFRKKRLAASDADPLTEKSPSSPQGERISPPLSLSSAQMVGGQLPRQMWSDSMRDLEEQVRVAYVAEQREGGRAV